MSKWNNNRGVYKSFSKTVGEENSSSPSRVVLGVREHNIIKYAFLCREFRLCELIEFYHRGVKGKERMRLFNMYYCALNRLVKRGYVVRVSRGVYRLVKTPIPSRVIDTRNGKNDLYKRKSGGEEKLGARARSVDSIFALLEEILGVKIRSSGTRRFRIRFHSTVRTMRPEDLVRMLYLRVVFVYRFSLVLKRELERYLSRRERRYIVRLVRAMLSEVVYNGESAKVGIHRLYFGRSSVSAPNDGLLPISFTEGIPVRASEVGVDVVFRSRIDFRALLGFMKIYVEDLGSVERVEVPLVVGGGGGGG